MLRWSNGEQPDFVNNMLEHLGWDTLEQRRNQLTLLLLDKIIHQLVKVPQDAGDFNLPSILWSVRSGEVTAGPLYGLEVNHLLVDTANDNNQEQLINEPAKHFGLIIFI